MSEYGFDPKFILTSLITIYSAFVEYPGFIEYVIKDQRAFKLENFEKVFDLKNRNKIHIGYSQYSGFTKFYELAKQAFEDFKEKCVIFVLTIFYFFFYLFFYLFFCIKIRLIMMMRQKNIWIL